MSNDTINRQEAIDALWKALYEYEDKKEKQVQESDELDMKCIMSDKWSKWMMNDRVLVQNMSDIDRQTILNLPPARQWTPCSEGLSDYEEKDYWVCDDGGYQYRCRWTNDRFGLRRNSDSWGWYFRDVPPFSRIVAWMPLPEPYKEEENEHTD